MLFQASSEGRWVAGGGGKGEEVAQEASRRMTENPAASIQFTDGRM